MGDRTAEPGPSSTEESSGGQATRRSLSDVVIARDGATLVVSVSRRGAHRIGAIMALALSLWISWTIVIPTPQVGSAINAPSTSVANTVERAIATAVTGRSPEFIPEPVPPVLRVDVPTSEAVPTAPRSYATAVMPARSSLPIRGGYVLSVDGRASDVRFAWDDPPWILGGDWAFEIWLRPLDAIDNVLLAVGQAAPDASTSRLVWIEGTDVRAATFRSDGTSHEVVAPGAAAFASNAWHHLAVSWSSGNAVVVVDGNAQASTVRTSSTATALRSGKFVGQLFPVGPDGGYVGEFDEVRVWSTGRAPEELIENATRRLTSEAIGLAHYFPVSAGFGIGASVEDATGRGDPIQISTGARWVPVGEPAPSVVSTPFPPTVEPSTLGSVLVTPPTLGPSEIVVAGFSPSGTADWVVEGDARLIGDGWLRLADAAPKKLGVARYERDLPLARGLTIRFTYRLTRGTDSPADGVVAFLRDPSVGPFALGYGGGSLGYARYCQTGLAGALIGVGIDAFGTFGSSEPTCSESPLMRVPNTITVRGPGHRDRGYDLVASSRLRRDLAGRQSDGDPVEVTISVFNDGTISVKTRYLSEIVPYQDIARVGFVANGIPIPPFVRLGFAGTTGGLVGVHDIRDVVITIGSASREGSE